MKKIISIISALMLLTSCTAKETPSENAELTPINYTAEKLTNIANYKKESLPLPKEMFMIYTFMPYNNSNEYLLLGSGRHTPQFWKANADFTEFEEIEYPEFDIGKSYCLDTTNDGTTVVFVNHVDYGDLEPIGLYDYPEDYDEELYDSKAEYKFMIKTFKDGKLVSAADVSGYDGIAEKSSNISNTYSDGKIVIVELSGAYEMFRIDGSYIGELETEDGFNIEEIGHDRTGRLICAVSYKENDEKKLKICLIDEDGKFSDMNNTVYNFSESVQGIQQGNGDYDFFIWSRSTVFGVKSESYDIEPLININISGFTSDTLKGVFPQSDGTISALSANYKEYKADFKKYTPRTPEEMENMRVLTYGIWEWEENSYDGMQEEINKWNDEGHDFMLELKVYTATHNDGVFKINGFVEDALSGNLPDIFSVDEHNCALDINLAEMDALCDLYEFIDNDNDFSRDSFVPNILECAEDNGKLYSLPEYFMLNIDNIAKAEFVGDASEWNFDKYIDMTVNPPIDIEYKYDSKRQRFGNISTSNWIDSENATCHFTDESFIKILNWCNEPEDINSVYPDEEERYEEHLANFVKEQRQYIENKRIFFNDSWSYYSDYPICAKGVFANEPIVFTEKPELYFRNTLAITKNSPNKDIAWEYLKSRITDKHYEDDEYLWGFPMTKSALKNKEKYERTNYVDYTQYEDTKNDPHWADYHGLIYQMGYSICDENAIQIGEITDEDVEFTNKMIAEAEPTPKRLALRTDYYDIINEETDRFFNGGCTAEECADVIQSRISIYLSERFG